MEAYLLGLARPYIFRLALAGIAALAFGGYSLSLKVHFTNVGYQRALDDIAADNKEAIDAAAQARARVHDCRTSGGVWDTASGLCQRR